MNIKNSCYFAFIAIFSTTLLTQCYSNRQLTFEAKKIEKAITILFDRSTQVVKKKSINNLFAKYLNDAPKDEVLLQLINQYTCYYLFELGYENIHIITFQFFPTCLS